MKYLIYYILWDSKFKIKNIKKNISIIIVLIWVESKLPSLSISQNGISDF